MQGIMSSASGSSVSDSPSFRFKSLTINSPIMDKTPKAVQRSLSMCLPDQASPFKQLEDDAKSIFPLVEHCVLPSISVDLLSDILAGKRHFPKNGVVIIDTRHEFEFTGGHIKGAVNLSDPSCIEEFFTKNLDRGKEIVIIFHCEFSSARAPRLFKLMRNMDRQRHIEVYPTLGYPHMYILHGGYKAFFDSHPEFCDPNVYVRMVDPLHAEDLRTSNRLLKRSWNARSYDTKSVVRLTPPQEAVSPEVLNDLSNDVPNTRKKIDLRTRTRSCLIFGAI